MNGVRSKQEKGSGLSLTPEDEEQEANNAGKWPDVPGDVRGYRECLSDAISIPLRPLVARVGGAFGVAPADIGTDHRLAPARAPAGPERLAHLAGRFGINLPQALLLAWAHLLRAGGAKQRQRGQGVLLAIYPAVGALLLAEDVLPQCGILVAEFFSTVMSIYKGIEVGG